jgi:hypothetical protein
MGSRVAARRGRHRRWRIGDDVKGRGHMVRENP